MSNRINISSGAPWESLAGYSRAVIIDNRVEISGTVAQEHGEIIGQGDMYIQTCFILEKLKGVLKECGSSLEQVIRTRMYVTDITQWQAAAKAHGEFFKNIKPATTMVEVSALIDPDYLIEIEVTAQVG